MPFRGDTSAAIFDSDPQSGADCSGSPEPGRARKLDGIINKALEKDCEVRYQSARDLMIDLTRLKRARSPADGAPLPESRRPAGLPSLAVLPFTNMSADKENEYFCDGLSEEIINALATSRS